MSLYINIGLKSIKLNIKKRDEKYLLLKAPPASGKSRALMFIALDKLLQQNIKKVIVAVPEKSIGGSFGNADLSSHGFESDWHVQAKYNLCTIESNESRSAIFKEFLTNDAKILICTHATLRNAFETINESRFDDTLLAMTGSYFRGDAHPILLPEVEELFDNKGEL